jgi:hypothetical protein
MRNDSPTPLIDDGRQVEALFDDVMQRLFAAGVGIEAIVRQMSNRELAARLAEHIAELGEVIEEIRARTGQPARRN